MFETAGPLILVDRSASLVLLLVLPLVWAAIAAAAATSNRGHRVVASLVIALAATTLALAGIHAFAASTLPKGRIALQHVASIARIGQLDVALDLLRDPPAAAFAVLVAFVAFVAVVHGVWVAAAPLPEDAGEGAEPGVKPPRRTPAKVSGALAWTGLLTAAVLLVVLADGLPIVALGLQLATLAGWALARGGRGRPLGFALAGDATVAFATCLLFWLLGGALGPSGYTLDPQPRFALVATPSAGTPGGKASVSLTTYDEATVTSEDGPALPGEPLRAPFEVLLDPGVFSFRIQAGAATPDVVVTHVTVAAGGAYVLSPYGPTASLRNLADQLAVPRPSITGPLQVSSVLASRKLAGVPLTTVVVVLFVLGALLRLGLLARAAGGLRPCGTACVLEATPPVMLALRLAPLLDASAASAAVVALLPAVAAVVLAADSAAARSRDRGPKAALGALSAFAMVAVFLGDPASAIVVAVAGSLGAAAAMVALEPDADVRWLGVACAGMAGLLPGAGTSAGIAATIARSLQVATEHPAGIVSTVLLALVVVLAALGVFRVYGASIRPNRPAAPPRGRRALALAVVVAVLALVAGTALGAGTKAFGGSVAPLARRLVAPPATLEPAPGFGYAALALCLGAAVAGLAGARRATRTALVPRWVMVLGATSRVVHGAGGRGSGVVRFFVRGVLTIDREVIAEATRLTAALALRVAGRLGFHDAVGDPPGAAAVVVRTESDEPRNLEALRLGLVLAMLVALSAVVAVSSLLR